MRRFIRENSLSLFFLTIFLLASSFGQAVMENWQSEYLQFAPA